MRGFQDLKDEMEEILRNVRFSHVPAGVCEFWKLLEAPPSAASPTVRWSLERDQKPSQQVENVGCEEQTDTHQGA